MSIDNADDSSTTICTDEAEYYALASGLLSQQIWCFGQDVERREGNWLVEFGFHRKPPPAKFKDCSSVYSLEIGNARRIILRGFGVFIVDDALGVIYIKRYGFHPLYSAAAHLFVAPWAYDDLPPLSPASGQEEPQARLLLAELIAWFAHYEDKTTRRLGEGYRQKSLHQYFQNTTQ